MKKGEENFKPRRDTCTYLQKTPAGGENCTRSKEAGAFLRKERCGTPDLSRTANCVLSASFSHRRWPAKANTRVFHAKYATWLASHSIEIFLWNE